MLARYRNIIIVIIGIMLSTMILAASVERSTPANGSSYSIEKTVYDDATCYVLFDSLGKLSGISCVKL